MRWSARLYLAILVCVATVARAEAQTLSPPPQDFPVEWRPRGEHVGPGIEGYVYNRSAYRVGSVRLKVEVLDGSSRVIREQWAWVYGAIDAGGRGYFVFRPRGGAGETYRITVESFDLISRQAP